jgi:twitching motility protein PilT
MARIDDFLRLADELNASDVHLKADRPPLLRIYGDLVVTDLPPLDSAELVYMLTEIVGERAWDRFSEVWELDVAYQMGDNRRFRLNLFRQRGTVEAVFRVIPRRMLTMEEMGLPELACSFATRPRGLVLVTGPVGSGKTTTQAGMIDHMNEQYPAHIITIEDPIEFVHDNKKGLVSQRELELDTDSFADGLRAALREDPDVILVGEMRDLETVRMAITAAETGHLVVSTLHTVDAAETINRVVDIFPTHQQNQVRMQLAVNLLGVIGQALVRRADGNGRVAAFEVMSNNTAVASAIRDNKIYQIASVIQTGTRAGMISLDQSLAALVRSGQVGYEEALAKAKIPDEFAQFALREKEASSGS